MSARHTFSLLGGSLVVYAVMAACGPNPAVLPVIAGPGAYDLGRSFGDLLTNPVPSANADSQSGSRLKVQSYAGADGSKQFVAWMDSQLGQVCGFQRAADGVTRCLPSATVDATIFFADAACTVQLGWGDKCVQPAYAARVVDPQACDAGQHVYPILQPYSGNVYVVAGAGCAPFTVRDTDRFYALGPEVSPSTFVAATLQTER